jgi:hypothetical protein
MFYIRGASLWQQDQAWRDRSLANQSDLDVVTAVTSKMSTALTNLSGGLASIANRRALARVQAQIKTATAALKSGAISSTSSARSSGTAGSVVNKTA